MDSPKKGDRALLPVQVQDWTAGVRVQVGIEGDPLASRMFPKAAALIPSGGSPGATLAELQSTALGILATTCMDPEARRLAQLVLELDGHLSMGGELPRRWSVGRMPRMRCPVCRTMRPVNEIDVVGDDLICGVCAEEGEALTADGGKG